MHHVFVAYIAHCTGDLFKDARPLHLYFVWCTCAYHMSRSLFSSLDLLLIFSWRFTMPELKKNSSVYLKLVSHLLEIVIT